MTDLWRKLRAGLAVAVAVVSCPCHLLVTLPVLLTLTAGTSLGAALARAPFLYVLAAVALFVGSGYLAVRWLQSMRSARRRR